MELFDAMRTTSAVREFTGEAIPDDLLHRILDHARFAPSGGNRQGAHVIVVRERATREALVELTTTGAKRSFAQILNGEAPWNPIQPCGVTPETVAATDVPDMFTEPLLTASVVLVVSIDLAVVAATDQDLDRVGLVGGASIYPRRGPVLTPTGIHTNRGAKPDDWLQPKRAGDGMRNVQARQRRVRRQRREHTAR